MKEDKELERLSSFNNDSAYLLLHDVDGSSDYGATGISVPSVIVSYPVDEDDRLSDSNSNSRKVLRFTRFPGRCLELVSIFL